MIILTIKQADITAFLEEVTATWYKAIRLLIFL